MRSWYVSDESSLVSFEFLSSFHSKVPTEHVFFDFALPGVLIL